MNDNTKQETPRLPVGISDFREIIEGRYLFADKTNFIKEIMQDGAKVILITRPRRFGKTLNLSMLSYFLQINPEQDQNLFKNLAISQDDKFCSEHQQKYPVIFISFKDIKEASYEKAYRAIIELMGDLYGEHRYLLEGDCLQNDEKDIFTSLLSQKALEQHVISALQKLSAYLTKKFNKPPVILIDEYDTPIQEAYLNGYYDDMIKLMRSIFGRVLKDNKKISKAVLTGITRVAQAGLFSGVNNFAVYTLLREKYGQYFGFTESEVAQLIKATGLQIALDSVRAWYNGYKIGEHVVYNPWSIITCLDNNGKLEAYWVNTSSNDLVRKFIEKANGSIQDQFENLLQGKTVEKQLMENLVFPELDTKAEAIWSLLLYAGYLNVLSTHAKGFRLMAQVSVPNREVMHVYDEIVTNWFRKGADFSTYDKFIGSLISGRTDDFKEGLSKYLMEAGSYFDFNKNTPEKVFHSFMLGLVVGLKENYTIQSNQESGLGRFDVIFIPRTDKAKAGILLEFKVSDDAKLLPEKSQEALQQIKDQKYITLFKAQRIASVLAIGLAFCGKQVELAHEYISVK